MNWTIVGHALQNTTDKPSFIHLIPYEFLSTVILVVDGVLIAPIIFGNLLILVSIVRFHRLRTRINLLVANLAVSDLLLAIVFIPVDMVFLLHEEYADDKEFCLIRHSLQITLLGASTMNLFAISLERYVAVVKPLKYGQRCSKGVIISVVCGCWVTSIMIGALPLSFWNKWEPGIPCDIEFVLPKGYKSLIFIFFTTSLITNFVMYIKVMKTAWKHMKTRELKDTDCPRNARHVPLRKRNLKKTKIMIILLGLFAVCWGPYIIAVFIDMFFVEEENVTSITVRRFLSIFGQINSGLNWIIFGFKNNEFRRAFKYLLSCGLGVSEGHLAISSGST